MKSIIQTFIGLCIILYAVPSLAQADTLRRHLDRDKYMYERIMEAETDRLTPDSSGQWHQYYLLAEELPAWFFKPSGYSSDPVFAIGISEPGMDSLKAEKLAVLRAKSLALLSTQAKIDNISDHFQVVRESDQLFDEGSRYLDFSRMYRKFLVDDSEFTVNETFYTKYGEAIALVSYDPGQKGKDTLSVDGEIMHLSREDAYLLENTVLCRLDIDFSTDDTLDFNTATSRFLLRRYGDHFNITSVYNGDSLEFPFHPYRYTQSVENPSDSSFKIQSCPLKLGLWNAYLNLVFSKISYFNRKLESRVKTSYDHYNLKQQGLIRTVSRNRLRFVIHSLALENNELFLKIDISPY
jgi:hypothetical protein